MRYKAYRSGQDHMTHVLCLDGRGNDRRNPFERLPQRVRSLGPWVGGREGHVADLKTRYRVALVTEGFLLVHRKPTQFEPEVEMRRHVPRPPPVTTSTETARGPRDD